MNTLREQIASVTRNVAQSTQERLAMVADSKRAAAQLLSDFRQERTVTGQTLAAVLGAEKRKRENEVAAIKFGAKTMRRQLRQAGSLRQRGLRQALTASTRHTTTVVSRLKKMFAKERTERRSDHKTTSDAQREALAQTRTDISRDVGEMLGQFRKARQEMSRDMGSRLRSTMESLRADINGLRGGFMPAAARAAGLSPGHPVGTSRRGKRGG